MKLKYYMRGLGLGIILTTLIITFSGANKSLSDKEIINRAMKLGMVMKSDSGDNLDKMLQKVKPSETSVDKPTPTQTPLVTQVATITPTAIPTIAPTKAPKITKKPDGKTAKDKKKTASDKRDQNLNNNAVKFTIKKGMSSGTVAKLLYKKGLIDDATKFNAYIVKNNKQNSMGIGTYVITGKPSYELMLKMIAMD